ncbi:phosphoribosyltransferase [Streptomyces radicis]|uniref:Phosphoribosyltransferase n=1 Tax=Streptomyces radicis TaxID=1750517 RepID=A0A3A9W781_9ACTN|nr:phosphoribosyltransferase [Streptomyces radicis]RKN13223.1 phosphoribosyltransferase [Streptomyces radicis]
MGLGVTGSAPVPARVFEGRRTWRLTPDAFTAAARLIAGAEAAHRPQAVVGIARGGTQLAEWVAAHLSVPAVVIGARHNTTDAPRASASGRVRLDAVPEAALAVLGRGRRLLVVDDVVGSGATLRAVLADLAARVAPVGVRTAVLCRNAGTRFAPDTWGWEVADWVVFPWEAPPPSAEPLPALTRLHHRTGPPVRDI